MHWGRLLACPSGWFPAPMGVNLPRWGLTVGGFLPRWRGWSREGSAVGLAAGRPGHQARLVGPVAGNGAARGSCGRADGGPGQPTAPLGAPGEGNAAALVCPSDTERAVPVHQDPRSTVEPPCPRAPEPGGRAPMDCFHSDTDTTGPTFTAMARFASVITLAKWRYPFENSTSLAKQPERPTPRARPRKDTFRPGLAKQPERPTRVRDFPLKARHHPQNSPSNPDHGRLMR